MAPLSWNPSHPRRSQAGLAASLPRWLPRAMAITSWALIGAGAVLLLVPGGLGIMVIGLGLCILPSALWLSRSILALPTMPLGTSAELAELLPAGMLPAYRVDAPAAELVALAAQTWQGRFVLARLGLSPADAQAIVGNAFIDHQLVWSKAQELAGGQPVSLHGGNIIACLMLVEPAATTALRSLELSTADVQAVLAWCNRLDAFLASPKPLYGGIARDWAAGYTPLLSHFGQNLSQQVEYTGKYLSLEKRVTQLEAVAAGLTTGSGSIVLVGEPGIGKTSLLLGLADAMLQGHVGERFARYQIVSLSASAIVSEAAEPGRIEHTVTQLFNEAAAAGNIILALDEAQLFFGQGTGAVNLSQLLLPVLQGRAINLILAVNPGDWQKTKATNVALAGLLSPVVLTEPDEAATLAILADHALMTERPGTPILYPALKEAYRLSGRYLQDEAYPGKAIQLLESSLNYPEDGSIRQTSVQRAVEAQFGVEVGHATQAETAELLSLEDRIHERMINQKRAVSVVASALRRARAGIANQHRPIGSFLFLGPTGVGKTELARSLAAVYFGDQENLIRLDMSEYQEPASAERILADASENAQGLLPRIRQQPFSVVLFDEIEKAHPNILNLLLQLLEEGELTDLANRQASFRDAIIIATSNAGADEIREHIEAGQELEQFEKPFIDNLISGGSFKPELLNRFDEIVLFRPLKPEELMQVLAVMMGEVNRTLEDQQISVELTPEAAQLLVSEGYDARLGARPLRRVVQRRVEDAVANLILGGQAKAGDHLVLSPEQLAGQAQTS